MQVRLFCDGASSNNQNAELRNGGYGVVVYIKGNDGKVLNKDFGACVPGATNNQMELTAVLEGLKTVPKEHRPSAVVHVQSDSQYVINIFSAWIEGWKKKGWKKAKGNIENLDLIKEIDGLVSEFKIVNWEHVKRCSNTWVAKADFIAAGYAGSK